MTERIQPKSEINISLASQLSDKNPSHFFRPDTYYIDQAQEAGYYGIEWYPLTNLTKFGRQSISGNLSSDTRERIRSAHQTWRKSSFKEAVKHDGLGLAIGSAVLFPSTDDSLVQIENFQDKLDKKLPVVVYPDSESGRYDWTFGEKTYQPYSPVMQEFKAENIQEMIDEGKKRGFDSITLDIHHVLDLGKWQEIIPQLLPHTTEIHLALGRVDQVERDPKTLKKLEDLYFGRKDTEIYKILESIKSSGWKGRIVTEIPFAGIMEVRRNNKDNMNTDTLVEDHRRIVDNVKEILE